MMYKTVVGNCALECDSKSVFQPGPKSSIGPEPSHLWLLQLPPISMPRVVRSEKHRAALSFFCGLAPLFTLNTLKVSQSPKEYVWLNWVPVAKIPKTGIIISVGLQGDGNKLTRMKSAQKISHAENNYTEPKDCVLSQGKTCSILPSPCCTCVSIQLWKWQIDFILKIITF